MLSESKFALSLDSTCAADTNTFPNRYDIATASDIRYYAVPELQKKIEALENQKIMEDSSGSRMVPDSVTPEAIAEVVARWTGIPVSRLLSSERQKLLKMEKVLARQVVGQPEAVTAVANAIRLSRSGLANASRPIASFLFAGPSGTGKTLLSKTVSTTCESWLYYILISTLPTASHCTL